MKKFIFFILLLISGFAFSQVKESIKAESEFNDKVDQASEFPGGINALRAKIAHNFNVDKVKGSGISRTVITFIVDREGEISFIKAVGKNRSFNKEAKSAVSKIKDIWKPAIVNGEKVRSRYRLPLTIDFN